MSSVLPAANAEQETIDLMPSDDESSEREASNVDYDTIDDTSC